MKTKSQNTVEELGSRSAHHHSQTKSLTPARKAVEATVARFSTPTAGDVTAQDEAEKAARTPRSDNRLPIDHDVRALNRKLDTAALIGLLKDTRPDLYKRATIVGTWVWLSFDAAPEAETRQQIAQLGFHWNNTRQVWQHPCGKFTFGSKSDPRDTYASKPAMEAFN